MPLKPTYSNIYEWMLEVLSIVFLVGIFLPLVFYADIGENTPVPILFNGIAEVARWGSRTYLLLLPTAAVVFYVVMGFVQKYCINKSIQRKQKVENRQSFQFVYLTLLHFKVLTLLSCAILNHMSAYLALNPLP